MKFSPCLILDGLICTYQVYVESYYCRLLLLTSLVHKNTDVDIARFAEDRLKPRFHTLLDHRSFREAHRIASDYRKCVSGTNGLSLLLQLVDSASGTSSVVMGNALVELVDCQKGLIDDLECRNLLQRAKRLYEQVGHSHGSLDVDFTLACHATERIKAGTMEEGALLPPFEQLLAKYNDMDYLAGQEEALHNLIDALDSPAIFDLQFELLQKSQELSERSGKQLVKAMRQFAICGRWLKRSAHFAKILENMVSLWEVLERTDCHFLTGRAALIVSEVYTALQDAPRATAWAEKCSSSWEHCLPRDISEGSTAKLRAKLLATDLTDPSNLEALVEEGEAEIQKDIDNHFFEDAVNKGEMLVLKLLTASRPQKEKYEHRVQTMMNQIESLLSSLGQSEAFDKVMNLEQTRMNILMGEAQEHPEHCEKEHQALLIEERIVKSYINNQRIFEAANTRQMGALCYFSIFSKQHSKESLQQCYNRFEAARDAFEALGLIGHMKTAVYWIALCLYEGWSKRWITSEIVLQALLEAEKLSDDERSEISILKQFDAIELKRRMASHKHVRDIYRFSIQICATNGLDSELWDWVQKAKARSLSDLIGLGVHIPMNLHLKIRHNDDLEALFQRELKLTQQIQNTGGTERLRLRHELGGLHQEMQKHENFRELFALREGRPVTLSEARYILSKSSNDRQGPTFVFVDWFTCNDEIYLLVLREGTEPTLHRTRHQMAEVSEWKGTFLDTEDGRETCLKADNSDQNPMRQLDYLVKPLNNTCNPDDILVLSPTGPLHSIPLHALWIRSDCCLVDSNPIIYCASLTTFVQCLRKTQANTLLHQKETPPSQRTVVAVYEPSPYTDFQQEEQQAIHTSTSQLSATHNMTNLTNTAITKQTFSSSIQTSTWFHFHGHCIFAPSPSSPSQPSTTQHTLLLSNNETISIQDFFSLSLPDPTMHVTLIACSSASQQISSGDEPLGIITALLCAGATSVVGTIWPTPSGVGRLFSKIFYEQIEAAQTITEQVHGDGSNSGGNEDNDNRTSLINLAKALQETVLDIKYGWRTRQPYYWASFVLHGSCFGRF